MPIEDVTPFFDPAKRYSRLDPSAQAYRDDAALTNAFSVDVALGWRAEPITRVRLVFDESRGVGGNDVLVSGGLEDYLGGGLGNDLLISGAGDDVLSGGSGNDLLYGARGDDRLLGGSGNDSLYGDAYIVRAAGGDLALALTPPEMFEISGDLLIPTLPRGAGETQPTDRGFADFLNGGDGDDLLSGGRGADILLGGAGNDILDPGSRGFRDNRDVLTGGLGADVFYLNSSETENVTPQIREFFKDLLNSTISGADSVAAYTGISSALEKIFTSALGKVLSGVLGSVIGGVFGAALSAIIDLVVKVIEESLPTSEDTVIVTDFDPREDVLVLPFGTLSNQDIRISVVDSENRIDQDGNGTGSSEKAIRVVKEFDDNSVREVALIFLSEDFLLDMNINQRNGNDVRAILQNVIDSAIEFNKNGAARQNIADQGLGDGANATSDKVVKMLGAAGPMLWAANNITEERLVVGTLFPDALNANRDFVEPGTELNNAKLGSVGFQMHGFGGADRLVGNAGADMLYGGDGDDELHAFGNNSSAPDVLDGGNGDDTMYASQLVDNLQAFGGDGIDTFSFQFEIEDAADLLRGLQTGVHLAAYSGALGNGVASPGIDGNTPGQDRFFLSGIELVVGSRFGDNISMTDANETIRGEAGDDILNGQAGDDRLEGGEGNDTLVGGAGRDFLQGGTGNDVIIDLQGGGDIFGDAGNDRFEINPLLGSYQVYGGAGNDRLVMSSVSLNELSFQSSSNYLTLSIFAGSNTTVLGMRTNVAPDGDDTNDGPLQFTETLELKDGVFVLGQSFQGAETHTLQELIAGSSSNDNLFGRGGNDIIFGAAGQDRIDGGTGNDWLYGGNGSDTLLLGEGTNYGYGGAGVDSIYGGEGIDTLFGEADNDVLLGYGGNDILDGGSGNDYVYGGVGNDFAYGRSGNDILVMEGGDDDAYGEDGNDYFYMGAGADFGHGGAGNDVFYGDSGNDVFVGNAGDDVFYGGGGNDTFEGGNGVDYAWGEGGNDTYTIRASSGALVINDFTAGGTDDVLRLNADTGITSFAGAMAASIYYSSLGSTILFVDGDTGVWLVGVNSSQLTAADFAFV